MSRSDVNAAIATTVQNEPQHFWYFNNGLTIICDSIVPGVIGRLNHDIALFKFEGISLVNGAQTAGMVSHHFDALPDSEKAKLWIQVRVIAVKSCPDNFGKQVTKYTNLQNAVELQDFVSLDPVQSRLSIDLAVKKRRYAYRSGGDPNPTGETGCTLKEATIALACAEPDFRVAWQGKREISQLWVMEKVDLYQKMFHANLTATRLWNAVVMMRQMETEISAGGESDLPRANLIASHMQWVVMHIAFQSPTLAGWDAVANPQTILPEVSRVTNDVFKKVANHVQANHANEYPASVSKNLEKCLALIASVVAGPEESSLFDGIP